MHDNQAPVKTGLLKFLRESVGGQFVIPVYQRNYTWKKKHIQKLLKDIEDLLEGRTSSHFIGSPRIISLIYRDNKLPTNAFS